LDILLKSSSQWLMQGCITSAEVSAETHDHN